MTRRLARFPIAIGRVLLVAATALLGLAGTAEAQAVLARGGLHQDFERLVLDFPRPVGTEITGEGTHLALHFDSPQALDLDAARTDLSPYLKKAALSPDGRTLALDFAAPVSWQSFDDGSKLVVDFALSGDANQRTFDKGPDAATASLGPRGAGESVAAAQPPPPPRIALRTGEHQGFSRLAFDWPKQVAYEVKRSGDQAELVFGSPATVKLDKVAGDLPPRLDGISVAPTSIGVTVKLALKPDTVLRDFRSGNTVVLDIYDKTTPNIPPQAQAAASPSLAASPVASSPLSATPQPASNDLSGDLAPQSALPAPTGESGTGQQAAIAPQLQSALPEPPAPQSQSAGISGPGVAVPVAPAPPPTFQPPRVAPKPVEVKVTALPLRDGATLYFDWPKPVGLAVFRRGDALWLVFDAPARGDLKALKRAASSIGKVETVASPFGLALRLVGGKAAQPATATEGARWKITLKPGTDLTPPRPLQPPARETLANGGASVIVQAIASGQAVALQDPADQARLVVTPEQLAGLGVSRESDFPDFKLLPTYQGVVVQPLNDRPKIEAAPNGVIVTTPPASPPPAAAPMAGAASTSSSTPAASAPPAPNPTASSPTASIPAASIPAASSQTASTEAAPQPKIVAGLFDFPAWRRDGATNFSQTEQKLENAKDAAAPADKERALLDLAEFNLANGRAPEAGGYLDQIRQDDPNADNSPLIMALAAAAKAMSGDEGAAERVLAAPALQGVAEANLLKAYVLADRGDTAAAAKLFQGPLPDISTYPKRFRTELRLKAAESLIDAGDPLTAQNFLDPLKSDTPDPETAARAAWLDGLRLLKLGKKDEAMQVLSSLIDSPVPEVKARAQFAVVNEQLAENKITPADALAKLDTLRYLWRGGTFEFDLLYKLGHLYFDTDQPRKGLITLREAATRFPNDPKAKQATDDMAQEFRHLYLEGAADRLSPLMAIALYDEFRELTPTGPDGERMIAALADRLVKVDLLDDAADLLDHQIRTRLAGADKVSAGTRLAAIDLLNDKPDLALKALAATDDPANTPPDLQAERQRLQARALFDTGDTVKGIDLVRNDSSLEGLWLRSDMFWRLGEWQSAADSLGPLIDAEQARRAAAAGAASGPDVTKNPASVLDQALAQAQAAAAASANPGPAANAAANPAAPNAAAPAPAANAAANPAAANPPAASQPAPNQPTAGQPAAGQPAAPAVPQYDPVLARLVLNRAVAMSLANDRRGLKDLARGFGKQMATSALAEPFKMLTSPDTGLTETISAQMKSVDQIGVFVDEYKKLLQGDALNVRTEPKPDTGPTVPMQKPAAAPGAGQSPQPAANQTAANQQQAAQ